MYLADADLKINNSMQAFENDSLADFDPLFSDADKIQIAILSEKV